MTLGIPKAPAKVSRSTFDAWTEELAALRLDPTVRKFIELQDKIDGSEAFGFVDIRASPSRWSEPYDRYDFFEFARDFAARELSSQHVARLTRGRFPETSSAGREKILHFLVDHGHAEVTRRTASGRPATYRFTPPIEGRREGKWLGLGLPTNELSRFKAADLDDIGGFPRQDGGEPRPTGKPPEAR